MRTMLACLLLVLALIELSSAYVTAPADEAVCSLQFAVRLGYGIAEKVEEIVKANQGTITFETQHCDDCIMK